MEVKFDAINNNIAYKPGMLGPWISLIGSGQTGDDKSEHQHFRNQWTEMDLNRHIKLRWPLIYYFGQKSLRRNEVSIVVNQRVHKAVSGFNLNNRMISVHLQDKSFNTRVIQVYAPTGNAEEAELNSSMKPYKTF